MSAIQTIINTYIKFADEQSLLALRAHRLKLLAAISDSDPFFRSSRSQCVEETSAIEAGLARLRPPAAPMADTAAAQSASPVSEHCSLHQTEIEPVASGEQELVPEQMAAGATSDQAAHGPASSPPPKSQMALPARAGASNPGLIASSLLGAALANAAGSDGTMLPADLIELQLRLERSLKG